MIKYKYKYKYAVFVFVFVFANTNTYLTPALINSIVLMHLAANFTPRIRAFARLTAQTHHTSGCSFPL